MSGYGARSGFANEYEVVEMLNSPEMALTSGGIRQALGISPSALISAEKVKGTPKPDVKVIINGESKTPVYLSLKKYEPEADFNHLCRTSVGNYKSKLGFCDRVSEVLKLFTGELHPQECKSDILASRAPLSDRLGRRANLNEINEVERTEVLKFFKDNRDKVLNQVFCGDDPGMKPGYMVITQVIDDDKKYYTIGMDEIIEYYRSNYEVRITARGSISLGAGLTAQRKGGSGSPSDLQFKFKPSVIVENLF